MALILAGTVVLPSVEASYGGIYEKTVRLHILAHSDDGEDQALKLKVRDEVLALVSPKLENSTSEEESERILKNMLPEIEECAKKTLEKEGSAQSVSAVLGKEYYPTRDYDGLSFPAGEYTSLRIFLGSGEGQNWWCVVYPPICLDAASASANMEKAGYTEKETALVEKKDEGYKVRFFLLDLAAKIRKLFD